MRKNKNNMHIYPKYMYPRLDYHKIPRVKQLQNMHVLRYMFKEDMPDGCMITSDVMKRTMRSDHFFNGMSVNLLSVFRVRDASFFIYDKDLTQDWNFHQRIVKAPHSLVYYNPNQGFYGFRIKDIEQISTTFQIYDDKGKPKRTDDLLCQVEHCPNRVNYWHFNIYLYGEEKLQDGKIRRYRLQDELKQGKVTKVASTIMDDFFEILKTKPQLHEIRLPKPLYRRGKKWKALKQQLVQKGHLDENNKTY